VAANHPFDIVGRMLSQSERRFCHRAKL
jgi:hypothetical protein